MKYSGIGGQAVLEGIMMKNKDNYATAVRKPDGEIVVNKDTYVSMTEKVKFFSLPFVRGIFSFADSMILGMRALTWSCSFFEDDEEAASGDGDGCASLASLQSRVTSSSVSTAPNVLVMRACVSAGDRPCAA